MRLAAGVEMLEISAGIMGAKRNIYPTLIWDEESAILVDAGFPGQLLQIREAIEAAGVPFNKLKMVILTHQDIDHVGSAGSIAAELPCVGIAAHEVEKPFINGEKCPVKLARLEANLHSLPDEMKSVYEKLKAGFHSSKTEVAITLADGEILPYCGGIEVIFTPGHTPGHICLYFQQSKILVAGDILTIEDNKLVKARTDINYDTESVNASLRRLADYDIGMVICYHGGLYKGEIGQRIKDLANS